MTVYVLDSFYIGISLLITIGWQLTGFLIAWTFQFDKITGTTPGTRLRRALLY
jgi:hypothetical protein